MGVRITAGHAIARTYAKREPHFCSSGPIILGKLNATSCSSESTRPFLQNHTRDVPYGKPSRRQCNSLLSYLKRWIIEVWYGVIRRLKSIFSTRVDSDKNPSNTVGKVPSKMDSELENAFWREGIQKMNKMRGPFTPRMSACWDHRYSGLGDHVDVYFPYRKCSIENGGQETRRTNSECHSDCEFKNKQLGSLSTSLDSPQTFDEEYNALYETKTLPRSLSDSGRTSSKESSKFSNLNGDRVSSDTRIEKDNGGDRVSSGSDSYDDNSKTISSIESKSSGREDRENVVDGKWIQTDCSESIWYSKSDLNNASDERKATARRTRASSRIPRLCSKSEKTLPERY